MSSYADTLKNLDELKVTVIGIRGVCPGPEDEPLEASVRRAMGEKDAAIAARDLTIGELQRRIDELEHSEPEPQPSRGFELVFSDEFIGTALDTKKWFPPYMSRGNAGVGWRSPKQVKIQDGRLRIVGVQWNESYLSEVKTALGQEPARVPVSTMDAIRQGVGGGLMLRGPQQYGRWEVRARVDKGNGYGPCIGLIDDPESWKTTHAEIDITEMPKGARDKSHFTVHYGRTNKQTATSTKADFSQWHIFGVEWTPTRITYFLDGEQKWETTLAEAIPQKKLSFFMQQDVGAAGSWIAARDGGTPAEVAFEIDWVKVYKYTGA